MEFSTGAHWVDRAPVAVENYRWDYLEAYGVTDLGEAFIQLNKKLSRNEFMSSVTGFSDSDSEIVSKQDKFIEEIKAQAKTEEAAEKDSFDDDGMVW